MTSNFLFEKKFIYRAFAFLLILCLSVSLVSCGGDDIVQNGITISDDTKPYSESTEKRASEVIYSLLEELYTNKGIPSLTNATKAELLNISQDVRLLTVKAQISEKQYNAILDVLEEQEALVLKTFSTAFGGESVSLAEAKSLYLALAKHTGADYVGALLYNLSVYGYDYNYNKEMQRYETYGYPHLLNSANEYKKKSTALVTGVGEESFVTAMKLGFMMSEVLVGGGFEDEKIQGFSNREVLLFLQHVKISSLSLSPAGWRLLASYFIPEKSEAEKSAINMLAYKANENGDLDELSESFSDFMHLLGAVQDNLDEADADALRSGNFSAFLTAVFSKFGEQEWDKLEGLSAISYEVADYEAICEEFYGEDFKNYSLNIDTVTLAELKASVGSDSFIQKLEGYVAGISPAFSYWLHI